MGIHNGFHQRYQRIGIPLASYAHARVLANRPYFSLICACAHARVLANCVRTLEFQRIMCASQSFNRPCFSLISEEPAYNTSSRCQITIIMRSLSIARSSWNILNKFIPLLNVKMPFILQYARGLKASIDICINDSKKTVQNCMCKCQCV